MAIDPQTRQQLLELAYDLLPPAEADQLRRKIQADAEWSKAYSQIRHELTLVAEAAKIEADKVSLQRPAVVRKIADAPKRRRTLRDRLKVRWPLMRGANWVVGLLAAFFSAIAVGGYWYHHERLNDIAAEQLRLLVVGPSCLHSGEPAVYSVYTSSVTGSPLPAQVEFSVLLPSGQRLWRDKDKSDQQGRLCVRLPADLKIPPEARLEVLAASQGNDARLDSPIQIAPPTLSALLTSDSQVLKPGQLLRWRLQVDGAFDLADDRQLPASVELLDPFGGKFSAFSKDVMIQHGIGFGEFELPTAAAEGRYLLVARSRDDAFAEVNRPIHVCGGRNISQEGEEKDAAPSPPPKVRVVICPEGGSLAADVENRVYFLARDSAGAPVAVKGAICDSRGDEVTAIATQQEGAGVCRFTPLCGESYRLRITEPAHARQEEPIGKVGGEPALALSVPASLVEASEPLRLAIRTRRPGMPLVVTVSRCGCILAQEPFVTSMNEGGLHWLSVPLGPEASGVLCVSVFDCSASPPRGVAERLVYRRPTRRLAVRAEGIEKRYAPGAKAAIKLIVANEQGENVDAVLSVAAYCAADLAASPIESSGDLDALCALSGLAAPPSAASLDMALGIGGWRRFVPRQAAAQESGRRQIDAPTPAVFDNIEQLRESYRKNLAAYRADRTQLLMFLTMLSLLGGLGMVLLVSMLVLLRVATGPHLWVMALLTAGCCLVAALALADPNRLHLGDDTLATFAQFDGSALNERSPKEAASRLVDREYAEQVLGHGMGHGTGDAVGSARANLWLPLVPTTKGTAELHFELPASKGNLILQIDARGDGRLGRQILPMAVE